MAKLTRVTGKVFGSAALAQSGGIGQFGSAATGTPNPTTDVATIQALQAYLDGWGSAVITSRNFPPIEEVTGVLKTISYQACYMLQEGIPEYDINTEYSNTSVVKSINNGITTLYVSLANGNIGNSLTDITKWKPYVLDQTQRNIGEIVTSTIPLTDAGLHLLDGSLLLGSGSYGAFVDYIANLYTADPTANYFTTEADWQESITAYGVCGKFVYDSVNNTVRLPLITGFVEGASSISDLGNLLEQDVKLPDITASWRSSQDYTPTGAAYKINTGQSGYGGDYYGSNTGFSAARSSSVYSGDGTDTTIHPQSIEVLYYIVVSTSVKTNIQVDIDEIETDLSNKVDRSDLSNVQCIVETYTNGASGYRIWSDGYCEQWGRLTGVSGWQTISVTFLKPFANTNYNITACHTRRTDSAYNDYSATGVIAPTTTGMSLNYYGTNNTGTIWWRVGGYII